MSKKIINKIIIAIIIGLIFIFLEYLIVEKRIFRQSNSYPVSVRNNFMENCVAGRSNLYIYCNCTFNYLQNNYSIKEFALMERELAITNQYPDAFLEAIDYCT